MNRRHTSHDYRAAIASLESSGWSISTDGSITRVRIQTKKITRRSAGEKRRTSLPRRVVVGKPQSRSAISWPLSSASWRPGSTLTEPRLSLRPTLARKRAPDLPGAARAATAADSWRASVTLTTQTSGNAFNVTARTHLHEYSQQRSSRCSVGTFIAPNFHFSTCGVAA